MKKYLELGFVIKIVCTLSHGNASVERIFSVRNLIIQSNMTTESLNSRRIIKDHMSSRNLKSDSLAISNELVLSVKSSRLKYEQLKQLNRDQDKLGKKNDQLEILNSEIKDINAKMEQLVKINQQLDNEFETFVFEAERLPQSAPILLSKAIAMKRKCKENKENKEDIKKLEGAIKVLGEKRQKLE